MKKTTKRKVKSHGLQVRLAGLMDRVSKIEKTTLRTDLPDFGVGDTLKIHFRIKEGDKERIQAYEGVLIAMSGRGASRTMTVRKMSHGVGVERIFLITSPKVAKIEIVSPGRVRRAKLYYLRGLEGKAARIERDVATRAQVAASEASKK